MILHSQVYGQHKWAITTTVTITSKEEVKRSRDDRDRRVGLGGDKRKMIKRPHKKFSKGPVM